MYAKKFSIEQITIAILLGLGILLPLIQFLYNRSLWLDEAWVALNIIHKGYFELLKPLDYVQVAPILFLIIEKFFSTLIPNSEYGLRLFPLLSYWASLFFFYKTIKILFNNKIATIFALSLFVLNVMLIYYSSEAKQYMSDVLVYTGTVYFILKDYRNERTKLYILSIVAALAIGLSNVAPIILSVAGLYLLYEQFYLKKQKNGITGLAIVFIIWLTLFTVYYYFFIFNHPAKELMNSYWTWMSGFLRFDSPGNFVSSLNYMVRSTILKMFSFQIVLKVIAAILLIAGIFSIIRKKQTGLAILACSPIIIHLLLSGLRLYPFSLRLVLYLQPALIFICTAGFMHIITWLSFRFKSLNPKLFCLTPIIFLFSFQEFPAKHVAEFMEVKETIKYLKENVSDNETIYVYWFAGPSFQYYQDIGLADFQVPVIIGKENRLFTHVDPSDFLKELEKIHGKCWLYFHRNSWGDEEYIINYFDSMGYKKIKEYKTCDSSIYLYDIK